MTKTLQTSPRAADVIAAAEDAGVFRSFLAAVAAADMAPVLRGEGPFTLFAPTDEAFAKFPSSTLDKLMSPDSKALLTSIVSFHFAVGRVASRRFAGANIRAKSFEGGELLIQGADGVVVNGARVVLPDLAADNGVIHGIDRVLWPKSRQADEEAPARD